MLKTRIPLVLMAGLIFLISLATALTPAQPVYANTGLNLLDPFPQLSNNPNLNNYYKNYFDVRIIDRNHIEVVYLDESATLIGQRTLKSVLDRTYRDDDNDGNVRYDSIDELDGEERLSQVREIDDNVIDGTKIGDLDHIQILSRSEIENMFSNAELFIMLDEDMFDNVDCAPPNGTDIDGGIYWNNNDRQWYCTGSSVDQGTGSGGGGFPFADLVDENTYDNFNITWRYIANSNNDGGILQSTDIDGSTPRHQFLWCEARNEFRLRDCDGTTGIFIKETPETIDAIDVDQITIENTDGNQLDVIIAGGNNSDTQNIITVGQAGIDNVEPSCVSAANSSFGWILCPVIEGIQDFLDWMFSTILTPILEFELGEEGRNTLEDVWSGFRYLATFVFVILFFLIIYSAATGNLFSAYDVKKTLPRLFIGAITVQASFFLSIYALELANILGQGIRSLLLFPVADLRTIEIAGPGDFLTGGTNILSDVTDILLGGLAGIVYLIILLILMVYTFTGVLLLAGVFIIRDIILVVLIVVSPVAFAFSILPGTEGYFRGWWKWYFGMLMAYPAMVAFLASGQLVATIFQGSNAFGSFGWIVASIALFLPYFLAPRVLQFAGQALQSVANGFQGMQEGARGIFGKEGRLQQTEWFQRRKTEAQAGEYGGRFGRAVSNPLSFMPGRLGAGARLRASAGLYSQSAEDSKILDLRGDANHPLMQQAFENMGSQRQYSQWLSTLSQEDRLEAERYSAYAGDTQRQVAFARRLASLGRLKDSVYDSEGRLVQAGTLETLAGRLGDTAQSHEVISTMGYTAYSNGQLQYKYAGIGYEDDGTVTAKGINGTDIHSKENWDKVLDTASVRELSSLKGSAVKLESGEMRLPDGSTIPVGSHPDAASAAQHLVRRVAESRGDSAKHEAAMVHLTAARRNIYGASAVNEQVAQEVGTGILTPEEVSELDRMYRTRATDEIEEHGE